MKKGSLDWRGLEASPGRVRMGVLPVSRLKNWPATGSSSGLFWQSRKPVVCGRALRKDPRGGGWGTQIRGPRAELGSGVPAVFFLLGASPDLGNFGGWVEPGLPGRGRREGAEQGKGTTLAAGVRRLMYLEKPGA